MRWRILRRISYFQSGKLAQRGRGGRPTPERSLPHQVGALGFELSRIRSVDGAFLHRERSPSVRPTTKMSFRGAVAVPESYASTSFETPGDGAVRGPNTRRLSFYLFDRSICSINFSESQSGKGSIKTTPASTHCAGHNQFPFERNLTSTVWMCSPTRGNSTM